MDQNIRFQQDITPPIPPPPPPSGMTPLPPPPPQFSGMQSGSASTLAIMSLVVGIAAYFICPLIGGIAAWIMGKMELNNIERGESSNAGTTLAKVGMWLGIVNVILTILVGLLYLFIIVLALVSSSRYN